MHTRLRPDSNDTGETLIELLMAIAIMGIAVVAIVGGIATSILMSDIHRKQASAGAFVRNYAEAVTGNYDTSALPESYLPSEVGFTEPPGYTATPTSVQCWVPDPDDGTKWVFGACTGPNAVQQVTLNVASEDLRASESLVVVVGPL